MTNPMGFTQRMTEGTRVGNASPVVVETQEKSEDDARTWRVMTGKREGDQIRAEQRKDKLESILDKPDLPTEEKAELLKFLTDQHHAFSLDEGERGETSLVQMEINTGDARPRRQPVR